MAPDTIDLAGVEALPAGEYAIVECLGHRTLIGRYTEVERFGTKMMSIEPLFRGVLMPAMLVGGSSLYAVTPCSAEVARARSPKSEWDLPVPVRAIIPPAMLPAPSADDEPPPTFSPAFLMDEEEF